MNIEIDTDDSNDDLGTQVRELDRESLDAIAEILEDGPTLYEYVTDEMEYRDSAETPGKF